LATNPPAYARQWLVEELEALGYSIDDTIVVEDFNATNVDEMAAVAAAVVASGPDVILTVGSPPSFAAKNATTRY
jgi:ABC-type uncharacterized transport system substrate-binding protein